MDAQQNVRIAQQVYERSPGSRRSTSDDEMASLLRLYSEDVDWRVPEMEHVRFAGRRRGRDGVREFFSTVADELEMLDFEAQDFIAQGEKVVVLGRYSWRVKATGKEFSSEWAHVYTIRGGEIAAFSEYMDTAAEVNAHQRR